MHIPLKETFARASTRKRLWLGAGAIAIFIGTLMGALMLAPADPHDQGKVGLDFIAFYTAGNFVRDGKSADLYDIRKVHTFQSEVARKNGVDLGSAVGPWWNPPFYAWVFVPLAKFPYRQALGLWVLFNIVCAGISAAVLCTIVARAARPCLTEKVGRRSDSHHLNERSGLPTHPDTGRMPVPLGWRSWALVPVLIILSTPFIHALSHAQNTCTSLLLLTITVVLWRKQRAVAAGLVGGLLFYKPQLAAVLTCVLVFSLGWRSLIGLSITGVALLLASLALPGSLHDFLHQMPRNIHFVQCDVPYLWDRHVTFKAFWRLLIQGKGAGEPVRVVTALSWTCSAAVGAGLLWAAVRVRKDGKSSTLQASTLQLDPATRRDRLIAATIAATPLLMPFYFDYDQLLLAIPAVLLAADFIRRDRTTPLPRTDLWLMRLWPVQYAWLMLNPAIASMSVGEVLRAVTGIPCRWQWATTMHVNLGVILLTTVSSLLIARAARDSDVVRADLESPLILDPLLKAA